MYGRRADWLERLAVRQRCCHMLRQVETARDRRLIGIVALEVAGLVAVLAVLRPDFLLGLTLSVLSMAIGVFIAFHALRPWRGTPRQMNMAVVVMLCEAGLVAAAALAFAYARG
jgi:uncharacterized membrane protein YfhO